MAKVKVSQGWLEGELLKLVTGDGQYYSFKGIPYAAPPIGTLRFKSAQPSLHWEGIRKATEHGPICSQRDNSGAIIGSEDCLYLNVYTQNTNLKTLLPVMVFIHGGGFAGGSGNDSLYGPDFLVKHKVVLVTINYRLGPLGFLCLDIEEVPGNAGLKDQNAALRWVKENISHFGGDPNNVTIFGQSAGGASVVFHLISPMSKNLFKRAISMSSVPLCDWVMPYKSRERAFVLGKRLGIDTQDPKKLLEFLQKVPVEKLLAANPTVIGSEIITRSVFKMFHFVPVAEKDIGLEHFLTEPPLEAIRNRRINEADLYIGHSDEETLSAIEKLTSTIIPLYNIHAEAFVPKELLIQSSSETNLEASKKIIRHYFGTKSVTVKNIREFISYCSDSSYVYPIYRFLSYWPKIGNSKLYLYKFSCTSERNFYGNNGIPFGMKGAGHMDDCMYLFNPKCLNLKIDKGSKEYQLVEVVNTVFTNFAKYSNPTPDQSLGVSCPEYSTSRRQYLNIGNQLSIETHTNDLINFWRSIFEDAGVEF